MYDAFAKFLRRCAVAVRPLVTSTDIFLKEKQSITRKTFLPMIGYVAALRCFSTFVCLRLLGFGSALPCQGMTCCAAHPKYTEHAFIHARLISCLEFTRATSNPTHVHTTNRNDTRHVKQEVLKSVRSADKFCVDIMCILLLLGMVAVLYAVITNS